MPQELKRFIAVLGDWGDQDCRILSRAFRIENESDARDIAEDIALLEGTELIYLFQI